MKERIEEEKFAQFIFFRQWKSLRDYCHKKKISVIGDQAFYVSYDSADAWAHPEILKLDSRKRLEYVGGAPPDFFSRNGQIWRNPVYAWGELQKTGFSWWINRIRHYLNLFDLLRLDHFRGFIAYWQVPATAKTARKGRWKKAKSRDFFHTLQRSFPDLPFIAEDLGVITRSVEKSMKLLGIPGMRVLLFAFDGKRGNPHLPSNHARNSVAYTGNHDTNTVRGWFVNEATDEERRRAFKCIGRTVSETEISYEFIRLALASPAFLSIVPVQDILALGTEARMNQPGRQFNNWEWRVTSEQLTVRRFDEFGELTQASGRDS
jgi:4-alpha-glucanotransferase